MYKKVLNKEPNPKFYSGVLKFINFESSLPRYMDLNNVRCSYWQCSNKKFVTIEYVEYHLIIKSFVVDYYVYNHHGKE